MLCVVLYDDEEDAIRIAKGSPYGLAEFVSFGNLENARHVAQRIRTGYVHINGARVNFSAYFGGYKQSGNAREWGQAEFEEFLELKAVFSYAEIAR